MAREYLRIIALKQALEGSEGSLRRAIDVTAETLASEMILQSGGDLLAFAFEGPALIDEATRILEDAVRTDPELRAHLVGARAAVRLRRKFLRGKSPNIGREEKIQMAHAFAEAYCRHHLDQQTASLATLLAHEGEAIRLAAMRLSASVPSRTSAATVTSSDMRRR